MEVILVCTGGDLSFLFLLSRTSLASLSPLSLSIYSPFKPEFLSSFVIKEMDKFVTSIW